MEVSQAKLTIKKKLHLYENTMLISLKSPTVDTGSK